MSKKTVKIQTSKCPNPKCKATISKSKVYKTRIDREANTKCQYRECGSCCERYKTESSLY